MESAKRRAVYKKSLVSNVAPQSVSKNRYLIYCFNNIINATLKLIMID